jgi:hypothetical protein
MRSPYQVHLRRKRNLRLNGAEVFEALVPPLKRFLRNTITGSGCRSGRSVGVECNYMARTKQKVSKDTNGFSAPSSCATNTHLRLDWVEVLEALVQPFKLFSA